MHEQGGINLYAYANGDPLGYVDTDGRKGGPVSANPWDHAVYPGQTNSQCVYDCVENMRNLWMKPETAKPPSQSNSAEVVCTANKNKGELYRFASKKVKSEANDIAFDYLRYQTCGIYCEWME